MLSLSQIVSDGRNDYSIEDKLILVLYSLYFVLKPFYFWSSGLPQVSDIIFVLLIFIYLVKKKLRVNIPLEVRDFLQTGLLFVSYVFLANSIWMIALNGSYEFMIKSSFYIYNFLVSFLVVNLYRDYKMGIVNATYKAVLVSVFFQIVMYFIGGGYVGGRMRGGFNNPNQLGYYALLTACILMFTSERTRVQVKWFILGITCSTVLVLSSLSKAAIVSYTSLVFFYLFSKTRNKRVKRNVLILVLITSSVLVYAYQNTDLMYNNPLLRTVEARISSIGADSDDNLEGRGYNRITDHPEYWIFGAGEGEFMRFNLHMEFHSTLGNIQVSYWLIGLLIFLRLIYLTLRASNYRSWYIILSIMAYGLTHNGIRNSLFWVLLALMVTSQKLEKQDKEGNAL